MSGSTLVVVMGTSVGRGLGRETTPAGLEKQQPPPDRRDAIAQGGRVTFPNAGPGEASSTDETLTRRARVRPAARRHHRAAGSRRSHVCTWHEATAHLRDVTQD